MKYGKIHTIEKYNCTHQAENSVHNPNIDYKIKLFDNNKRKKYFN